jgi:RNA polymerase primary sigma factor
LKALLNCPDAKLLSADEERNLLVELVDCRERLLEAFHRMDGTGSTSNGERTEFQNLVRELANSATPFDPPIEPFKPLARRYQEIRTRLVMANVRLVAHIAKRYKGRGLPPGDLIQEGICALLLAIDRFDVSIPTRLATYAIWWIRQAIQRAVAAGAYPVRLNPRHLRQLARTHELSDQSQQDPPAPGKLPSAARCQTLDRLLAATRPTLALDATSRRDGRTAVVEFLKPETDESQKPHDLDESVVKLVSTLDPRERVVLNMRFGLGGAPCQTLVQVSRLLGVSKERVRQIQVRAMRKLRTSPASKEHRGELTDTDLPVIAFQPEARSRIRPGSEAAHARRGCPRAS